jgi:hypothetical protein
MRTLLKVLFILLVAVTVTGGIVTKTNAAQELGKFCWSFSHSNFDGGASHLLILQVTQHDWVFSLHGADFTWLVPVDGSAFFDFDYPDMIVFGVSSKPFGADSPPYFLGADLDVSTLSDTEGHLELNDGTRFDNVSVTFVSCP